MEPVEGQEIKETTSTLSGRPSSYVAIDLLGSSPKTDAGNKYNFVITEHYSKLNKAIPIAKSTATWFAFFMEHFGGHLQSTVHSIDEQLASIYFQILRHTLQGTGPSKWENYGVLPAGHWTGL